MKKNEKLNHFYSVLKTYKRFFWVTRVLEWDRDVMMPPRANTDRAEKIAFINERMHAVLLDKAFISLVKDLYDMREEFSLEDQRNIELVKKRHDLNRLVPNNFIEDFTRVKSIAHKAWVSAKEKNDFSVFQGPFKEIVEYGKRYAEYIDADTDPYQVHFGLFQDDLDISRVDALFADLKRNVLDIRSQTAVHEYEEYALGDLKTDSARMLSFIKNLAQDIGLDLGQLEFGFAPHPFERRISTFDRRIALYNKSDNPFFLITSAIHEMGHALYDQAFSENFKYSLLDNAPSLGVDESQARLLENMIGKSEAFWSYCHHKLDDYSVFAVLPDKQNILRSLNQVHNSPIRILADELSYNLHIIVRYEIEKKVMRGELGVDEIPDFWNASILELFGTSPKTFNEGCLQDVHWSWGLIGYFPTYALGNIIAGQLLEVFTKDCPDWSAQISQGDFSSYNEWFNTHVWSKGSLYGSMELINRISGETLSSDSYIRYLKEKFLRK